MSNIKITNHKAYNFIVKITVEIVNTDEADAHNLSSCKVYKYSSLTVKLLLQASVIQ